MQLRITTNSLRAMCDGAVVTGAATKLHDTELKGFGCYISATGQVSWFVQRHIGGRGGKQFRTVIGHFSSMSIAEARKQALIDLGKIAAGEDISLRRKALLAEQRKLLEIQTVREVFEIYIAQLRATPKYKKEIQRYFENVIPSIGERTRITAVTKEHIKAIRRNGAIKSQKSIDSQCLRPFFKWCAQEDYISVSPMLNLPPLPGFNENDRVLGEGEIAILWQSAAQVSYPWGQYVKMLLLTGQRRLETAQMAWSEIEGETWTIPKEKTKTGVANVVHLSSQSLKVLENIPKKGDYVFSTRGGVPINGFGDCKALIDAAIGDKIKEHWTLHALRRTVGTGMQRIGVEPWVIEKILNHAEGSKVAKIYRRYEYMSERKEALDRWGAYIEGLSGGLEKRGDVGVICGV